MTERVRFWEPEPQVLEHLLNLDQAEVSQWMGQGPSLQGVLPVRNGHLAPPLAATVVTVRERVLTPLAQLLEHSLQEDHLEVTQSTGQALVLHC